jgi:hypothetical protein
MRKYLLAAGAALAMTMAQPAAAAVTYAGSYAVDPYNQADPGLILNVADAGAIGTNFSTSSLQTIGDTASAVLFKIYTLETSVNGDDLAAMPIQVDFTFTSPSFLQGSVDGTTYGQSFFGIFQNGSVSWTGGHDFDFGNGGKVRVTLNDATFNAGFFGLNNKPGKGAEISANFELLKAAAVPEPATWAMMIAGFGLAGTAIRRRRSTFAVA